jgi:hypothetical protein
MKTLIQITAHTYEGERIATPQRTYSFVRPSSASAPTRRGAERMVAKEVGCKPTQVSIMRVEVLSYDA